MAMAPSLLTGSIVFIFFSRRLQSHGLHLKTEKLAKDRNPTEPFSDVPIESELDEYSGFASVVDWNETNEAFERDCNVVQSPQNENNETEPSQTKPVLFEFSYRIFLPFCLQMIQVICIKEFASFVNENITVEKYKWCTMYVRISQQCVP